MLYYDRIDLTEGIDVNMTSESKECDICRYWYFLNKGFKFQPYVCNDAMNLRAIAISKIKRADYRCIISGIIKTKAINFMQNIDLSEESETL